MLSPMLYYIHIVVILYHAPMHFPIHTYPPGTEHITYCPPTLLPQLPGMDLATWDLQERLIILSNVIPLPAGSHSCVSSSTTIYTPTLDH